MLKEEAMKRFEIEFTTNMNDRQVTQIAAQNKTDAYLAFVKRYPKHYIITNLEEM